MKTMAVFILDDALPVQSDNASLKLFVRRDEQHDEQQETNNERVLAVKFKMAALLELVKLFSCKEKLKKSF